MSDESENKKQDAIKKLKNFFEENDREETKRLNAIFKEILQDPYYKENMTYYFRQFLSEKY